MASENQRPRNDPAQYDELEAEWWNPRGRFAMLHWIAAARAAHIPRGGGVLVDIACGAGLLTPHTREHGYHHVGIDLSLPALRQAAARGVHVLQGDVRHLPLRDEVADVVVAGEILEHVREHEQVISEACRILRPGGRLVVDTIADTTWARLTSITVGERIPGGPPPGLHDPRLYVDRENLLRVAAEHGVQLTLTGLRPSIPGYLQWVRQRSGAAKMVPSRSTAGLFQAVGTKERE